LRVTNTTVHITVTCAYTGDWDMNCDIDVEIGLQRLMIKQL